ncbi:hypothetical protein MC885_009885 [Smutsia gigantea]|nr:hypothetical protein MC885_009885 [Smutsia gigantea]
MPSEPQALCGGPAHATLEEVEDEKHVFQERHSGPLLQRGLHLPRALQPDPGGLPGGRGGQGLAWAKLTLSFSPSTTPPPASARTVDLVLAVWAHGLQFRTKPVGKVLLGAWGSGQPLQRWVDMLAHA